MGVSRENFRRKMGASLSKTIKKKEKPVKGDHEEGKGDWEEGRIPLLAQQFHGVENVLFKCLILIRVESSY